MGLIGSSSAIIRNGCLENFPKVDLVRLLYDNLFNLFPGRTHAWTTRVFDASKCASLIVQLLVYWIALARGDEPVARQHYLEVFPKVRSDDLNYACGVSFITRLFCSQAIPKSSSLEPVTVPVTYRQKIYGKAKLRVNTPSVTSIGTGERLYSSICSYIILTISWH
jgi:hypothetical protein